MQHDINEIKTKKMKNPKCSLSNGEQEAMKHLVKRRNIIINIADKGGTVVMNTENYIKEPTRQLSDKNSYKILQTDPTLQRNGVYAIIHLADLKTKICSPKKQQKDLK